MNLLRTGLLSGVATAAKLISGFLVLKVVAIYAGPEGVAQFGQFMSLATLLFVFSSGGISSGIVKYVAEYKSDKTRIAHLLSVGGGYTVVSAFIMLALVLYFSSDISSVIFGDDLYTNLISLLAFSLVFVAVHNFIVSITNGMMDVRRLAAIQVLGAALGLVVTLLLTFFFRLYGALVAYVLGQALLPIISYYFFRRSAYFDVSLFKPRFDYKIVKQLSQFSFMTLSSALLGPAVQIAVRNIMAERLSWETVGYWQAVTRVSDAYLLFITTAISVYYLPKLSALVSERDIRNEIFSGYRYLVPFTLISAGLIFIFRDVVTVVLYTDKFREANALYGAQLVGDVIKVASFVLSYLMLAKAMTTLFVFSEVLFSLTYVAWVVVMVNRFGVIGAIYAFSINYFFYFLFNIFVVSKYLRKIR